MASHPAIAVKLRPDRSGFLVGDRSFDGFPHLSELSEPDQTKIASWAKQRGYPLSPQQETLLAERPQLTMSLKQRMAQDATKALRNPLVHQFWDQLTKTQQQLVLNPSKALDGKAFPLSSSELARLVGTESAQIRRWADKQKLPHWKVGRNRLFPSAAAIIAFVLADADQLDQSFASRVVKPDGITHLRTGIGLAAIEATAPDRDPDDPALDQLVAYLLATAQSITQLRDERRANPDADTMGITQKAVA